MPPAYKMTEGERAAREAGKVTRRCLRPILENPHPGGSWERFRWNEGWREEDLEQEGLCPSCGSACWENGGCEGLGVGGIG